MKKFAFVLLVVLLTSIWLGAVNLSSGFQTDSSMISFEETNVAYKTTGNMSMQGLDYWWFSANAGDVLLIGVEASTVNRWTSQLYYSNTTLIQNIYEYDAHSHIFVVPKTGSYLLLLSSGYNSFNYTIDSSHQALFATPYTETGSLSNNEVDYWWFNNVNQGAVLVIGVEASTVNRWTSQLYFSNTTLIQSIYEYNAHSHIFVAPKTDNYLLVLSSGSNSFNYTIVHNRGDTRLPTTIKFYLEPNPATVGKAVTLQGNLTSNGSPIPNAQVTIKLGSSTVGTLTTNATGWFKATGTVGSAGTYNITVQYAGSQQHLPCANWSILIVKGPTAIYCRIDPNPTSLGASFTYEGILVGSNSQPIAGATIQIYRRTLSGSFVLLTSVTTDSYGIFRYQSTATTAGTFVYAAYYAGTDTLQASYNYAIQVVQ